MLKNVQKIDLGLGKTLKKTVAGGLCATMLGMAPCTYAEEIFLDGTSATENVTSNFCDDDTIGVIARGGSEKDPDLTTTVTLIAGEALPVHVWFPYDLAFDDNYGVSACGHVNDLGFRHGYVGDRLEPVSEVTTVVDPRALSLDDGPVVNGVPACRVVYATAVTGFVPTLRWTTGYTCTETASGSIDCDAVDVGSLLNLRWFDGDSEASDIAGSWSLVQSTEGTFALQFSCLGGSDKYDFEATGYDWDSSNKILTIPLDVSPRAYLRLSNWFVVRGADHKPSSPA